MYLCTVKYSPMNVLNWQHVNSERRTGGETETSADTDALQQGSCSSSRLAGRGYIIQKGKSFLPFLAKMTPDTMYVRLSRILKSWLESGRKPG